MCLDFFMMKVLAAALFHRDKDLVVFGHFYGLRVSIGIFGLRREQSQGRHSVPVEHSLIFFEVDPYLVSGEDDVMGTIGMFYGDGGFDRAGSVDGIGLIFFAVVTRGHQHKCGRKP